MSLPKPFYQDRWAVIYHGDCREILPQVEGDILLSSPPYGVQKNNMATRAKFKYGDRPDELTRPLLDCLTNANCKWRFINVQTLAENKRLIWEWVGGNASRLKDVIIWTKTNPPPAMEPGVLDCAFEFVFCFSDGCPEKRKFDGMEWRGMVRNVITGGVNGNEFASAHRAAFPEWLPQWFVNRFTIPEETVLDGCCGIGTTLIAAKQLGRHSIGIEQDESFCEIAARRLEAETTLFDLSAEPKPTQQELLTEPTDRKE